MKNKTVFYVAKYDEADRLLRKEGYFKSKDEANEFVELDKNNSKNRYGDKVYYIVCEKDLQICETMEEYNQQIKELFVSIENFRNENNNEYQQEMDK